METKLDVVLLPAADGDRAKEDPAWRDRRAQNRTQGPAGNPVAGSA